MELVDIKINESAKLLKFRSETEAVYWAARRLLRLRVEHGERAWPTYEGVLPAFVENASPSSYAVTTTNKIFLAFFGLLRELDRLILSDEVALVANADGDEFTSAHERDTENDTM